MLSFAYEQLPGRVVFGVGAIGRLAEEVGKLGLTRAIVLSTPEQAAQAEIAAARLGARAAGIFPRAAMHVPVEIARAAVDEARRLGADCAVAIGGGSTVGLGKAIALENSLPVVAVPTTYAGSEMTPIYGLTENGVKKTGRDARVLPKVVIYDPELTVSLPGAVSVVSGINAIAHCVEALYAPDANPIVSMWAEEAIRALASALPRIVARPDDIDARSDALYGAWLAGASLGAVSMSLHHKLCHTLGGSFNLPHAETHTAVLPHVVAYNSAAAPEAMARVRRALGANDAAGTLFDLARSLGATMSLADIGMPEGGIERAADLAVANPYANPRPVTREAIRALIADAFAGRRPTERS